MLKSYKTEINPSDEQKHIIQKTIGTCRFVYNFYLAYNRVAALLPCRFATQPLWGCHKLKEKGYIPTNPDIHLIKSGTVSYKARRYYISVLVEEKEPEKPQLNNLGLGIDLGIKDFAVISNGIVFRNINKTEKLKKLEKKLKREQCRLSRKYESLKKREGKKGEATRQNIQKQVLKVQRLHQRIENIRTDYINKCINKIVKTKPSYGSPKGAMSQSDMAAKLSPCYIMIEDLNVSGMMKNKHLSKAVASQKFYEFRIKLESKCRELGIELRIADRWYPSSKICHECGCIRKDLKLSDREYICECGYHADRDYNASLNLRDTKTYNTYKIA